MSDFEEIKFFNQISGALEETAMAELAETGSLPEGENPKAQSEAQAAAPAAKPRASHVPPLTERACVICGASFFPSRRNQVVCSDACRYQRGLQIMKKTNDKRRGTNLQPRECLVCGKKFMPVRKDEVCCSDDCKGEYMLIRNRNGSLQRYYKEPIHRRASTAERLARLERIACLFVEELESLKSELRPSISAAPSEEEAE